MWTSYDDDVHLSLQLVVSIQVSEQVAAWNEMAVNGKRTRDVWYKG
jgi:hypothetical protein